MKILLLVNNLGIGGAETQTVRLARELVSRGHTVKIGYFSKTNRFEAELDRGGIEQHHILPRPHSYRPWTFRAAARIVMELCDSFKPNVIHSSLELADVVGQMVTTKRHLPHVITFHNTHWWAVRNLASYWRIAYRKHWLKKGVPSFTAVSHAAAVTAAEALGIDERSVAVIHNGIDLGQYSSSHWATDSVSPNTWQLICVGRLEHVKGQDVLIRAMSSGELRRKPVRLLLAGDGAAHTELEALVAQLKLEEKVHFLGVRQDIPELLSSSDIYIQPSRSEGLSNALIEALAASLPVLVTDVPGMLEVLADKGHARVGHVVPRDDPQALARAIVQYIDNPLECHRQALLSRERAFHFSIEATAREMDKIYSQAIDCFPQGVRR